MVKNVQVFDDPICVFSAYITLRNGKRIHASSYGKKAFYFPIRRKK